MAATSASVTHVCCACAAIGCRASAPAIATASPRLEVIRSYPFQRDQCRDRLGGDSLAAAGEAEPLGGSRLHINRPYRHSEEAGKPHAHGVAVRPDLGRLADDRHVD